MLYFLLVLFASILVKTVSWAFSYFGLSSFEQLVFHIKVPLEGTNKRFLVDWFRLCFLWGFVISIIVTLLIIHIFAAIWLCWVWLLMCIVYSAYKVGLIQYGIHQFQKSDLYEQDYIEVSASTLQAPKKKMNLIHIYLESMETTYALKKDGGDSQENLLPFLTKLTKENISFSNIDQIGGAKVVTGTGWTTGGMIASTAGVPLNFPIYHPFCTPKQAFMNGLVSLGDILEKDGYSNTLMIGSDAAFGGRKSYFDQHGHYDIQDIKRIKEEGWLDENYHVFWGYEDEKLFDFAKRKLSLLAKEDRPFNFEMLTVDTHHPYGYQEKKWKSPFAKGISNSIYHTDRLLEDFMTWLKKQPFYKDTLIVIQGDHTSMAAQYIHSNFDQGFDRRVWNCFIHSQKNPVHSKKREFTTMDLFPTILSGMGYTLSKNGLALGRDLFSDEKTVLEKKGEKVLNLKIQKQSSFYKKKILGLKY